MIEIVSSVSVYLVFLLLPGALNSLVTRFKTHFVSRVTLLVVGSSLLFLLDCHSRSIRSMSVVFIDGLSSLSSNLLIYEVLLIFIALSVIGIGNLGVGVGVGVGVGKRPELVLIQLPNLIGIVLLLSSNDLLVTVTGWELFNLSLNFSPN